MSTTISFDKMPKPITQFMVLPTVSLPKSKVTPLPLVIGRMHPFVICLLQIDVQISEHETVTSPVALLWITFSKRSAKNPRNDGALLQYRLCEFAFWFSLYIVLSPGLLIVRGLSLSKWTWKPGIVINWKEKRKSYYDTGCHP